MSPFRLIIDPPNSGDWNMAADEVLLRNADATGQRTLRFYQWSEPTLSLGYFQNHADRDGHAASRQCPLIRRHSGGGAIMHDHELTYSLTLPISDRLSRDAQALYANIHATLVECLQSMNVDCELHSGAMSDSAFLCFQRRSSGDITLNDQKIMGSAQRRTKHGMLQHGSLLLRQSNAAPELPGIAEIAGSNLTCEEITNCWAKLLADGFSARFHEDMFAADEVDEIKSLANEKYRAEKWTFRR